MRSRRQLLARVATLLGAFARGRCGVRGQEEGAVLTMKRERLPWRLRDLIAGVEELLAYRGSRIVDAKKKTVLYAWQTKKKPPPGALASGRLLALLVPTGRLATDNLVTVRSVDTGRRADFSTVELERADRLALRLIYSPGDWRSLDVAMPLARMSDTDPLWQVLPQDRNGVTLSRFEDEYHLIFVCDHVARDAYRCVLPQRVANILDL